MVIEKLSMDLKTIKPTLNKIAYGEKLSFDEAWLLVTIYNRCRNTDAFIDYVEETPKSEFYNLQKKVSALNKETAAILAIYYDAKEQFQTFNAKAIYKEHLEPMKSAYQQAQELSAKAYKDYKELDNSLDMPELHYTSEELPKAWALHTQKKVCYDQCSKRTKELFEVYDRERRRTSRLFTFKLSSLVMLVYSLDEMSKALLADFDDIKGKEDNA